MSKKTCYAFVALASTAVGAWPIRSQPSFHRKPSATKTSTIDQYDDAIDRIEVKQVSEDKGFGVFSKAGFDAGVYLCKYEGENISYARLKKRYPTLEPDYVMSLGDGNFIDAAKSLHWSKYMNHDENANVCFDYHEGYRSGVITEVHFQTLRTILPGEELVFDYGVDFWDSRSTSPAPGTDSRAYSSIGLISSSVDPASAFLGTPMSAEAVDEILTTEESDVLETDKRAAMGRALDYFGVPINSISVSRGGIRETVCLEEASLEQLGDAVLEAISEADNGDFEDGDINLDAWEDEKEAIRAQLGDIE